MNNPIGRFTLDQLRDSQRIIARAWADDAFKAALLADPMNTLAREGFEVPAGLTIAVHESTADTLHVVLPPKPSAVLSDEDLAGAAGGFSYQSAVTSQFTGMTATGCGTQSVNCVNTTSEMTTSCNVSAASAFTG